jgi:histidyl-tRNA synthetase
VERVFSILEAKAKVTIITNQYYLSHYIMVQSGVMGQIRTVGTQVMVASAQKNLCHERMRVCSMLWDADLKV